MVFIRKVFFLSSITAFIIISIILQLIPRVYVYMHSEQNNSFDVQLLHTAVIHTI